MQAIIFPVVHEGQSVVAIMVPNLSCGLNLEQIIAKDVPANTPHKVVDASDIPEDEAARTAWLQAQF